MTGLPGRPTAWKNLIEPECRRRYQAGERHPNDRTRIESASEWAVILIKWLKSEHPDAPKIGEKALKNHLAPLLRELAKEVPPPP
jgi:hypothetical protein